MEERVGRRAEHRHERAHEARRVGLGEVALQGLVVAPLLDEDVAAGLLEVLVDPVADAAVVVA